MGVLRAGYYDVPSHALGDEATQDVGSRKHVLLSHLQQPGSEHTFLQESAEQGTQVPETIGSFKLPAGLTAAEKQQIANMTPDEHQTLVQQLKRMQQGTGNKSHAARRHGLRRTRQSNISVFTVGRLALSLTPKRSPRHGGHELALQVHDGGRLMNPGLACNSAHARPLSLPPTSRAADAQQRTGEDEHDVRVLGEAVVLGGLLGWGGERTSSVKRSRTCGGRPVRACPLLQLARRDGTVPRRALLRPVMKVPCTPRPPKMPFE
eukprot:scaffold3761_cov372-Prasinococcus_capsulatus_cf.AAC.12